MYLIWEFLKYAISSYPSVGSPLLSRNNTPVIRRTSSQASFCSGGKDDEESKRKEKLQIYVFISRCIAYPFNAKQPTDMTRRQTKVTKQNLIAIKERFALFLDGKTSIPADEALKNAVRSYQESFLCSDRVAKMVRMMFVILLLVFFRLETGSLFSNGAKFPVCFRLISLYDSYSTIRIIFHS